MVRAASFLAVTFLAAAVIATPVQNEESNEKRLLVGPKKAPKGYKNTGKKCDDYVLCMLYGLKDPVCVGGTSGSFTSGVCWVPKSGTKTTSKAAAWPTKWF